MKESKLKGILNKVKARYDKLSKETKDTIFFFLNYLSNSIPISIFIYIISLSWYDNSFKRYILVLICTYIFIIYFEYYYVWIRKDWDKDM